MPETIRQTSPASKPISAFKSIVLPFILSILANGIFAMVFLGGWLSGATVKTGMFAIPLFFVFLAGFPLIYLWLARKQALLKGAKFIYTNSSSAVSSAVGLLVSAVVMGQKVGGKKFMGQDLNSTINNLDEKIPSTLKAPFKFLLSRIPIYDFIQEVGLNTSLTQENLPDVKDQVQQRVDDYVKGELIGASSAWLWTLIAVNVAAMVLAWIFFT